MCAFSFFVFGAYFLARSLFDFIIILSFFSASDEIRNRRCWFGRMERKKKEQEVFTEREEKNWQLNKMLMIAEW
jgi:hypothetical protein